MLKHIVEDHSINQITIQGAIIQRRPFPYPSR